MARHEQVQIITTGLRRNGFIVDGEFDTEVIERFDMEKGSYILEAVMYNHCRDTENNMVVLVDVGSETLATYAAIIHERQPRFILACDIL